MDPKLLIVGLLILAGIVLTVLLFKRAKPKKKTTGSRLGKPAPQVKKSAPKLPPRKKNLAPEEIREKINEMVRKDPERVSHVLRQWINEGGKKGA